MGWISVKARLTSSGNACKTIPATGSAVQGTSSVVPNVLCLYNIVFYRATTVSKLNGLLEGHLTGHLSQVLLHCRPRFVTDLTPLKTCPRNKKYELWYNYQVSIAFLSCSLRLRLFWFVQSEDKHAVLEGF